jgi:hypothetical protein
LLCANYPVQLHGECGVKQCIVTSLRDHENHGGKRARKQISYQYLNRAKSQMQSRGRAGFLEEVGDFEVILEDWEGFAN